METEQQRPGKIHEAIVAVMAEIGAIEKTRKNQQQNFMFRGVGDAMAACQPLFVKYKMYLRPLKVVHDESKPPLDRDGKPRSGNHSRQTIVYRATSAEDGSYVDCEATGEAIDYADKAAGKVMSVSFKFLVFQLFCIPDFNPENDPDGHSPGTDGDAGENGNGKGSGQRQPSRGAQRPAGDRPKDGQQKAGDDDAKKKALSDLLTLLKRKGIAGKQVLPWLSTMTRPKRELKKMSDITSDEFVVMEKAASGLPAPGAGPTE